MYYDIMKLKGVATAVGKDRIPILFLNGTMQQQFVEKDM